MSSHFLYMRCVDLQRSVSLIALWAVLPEDRRVMTYFASPFHFSPIAYGKRCPARFVQAGVSLLLAGLLLPMACQAQNGTEERRQELRSAMRQHRNAGTPPTRQDSPAPSALSGSAGAGASAALPGAPASTSSQAIVARRQMSAQERAQLREQLRRDLRAQQSQR